MDHRCVDPQKMLTILRLLLEGNSIRALERTFGVHRDTIISNMIEAGEKCRAFMEKKVQDVQVNDVQCDEIWGFVGMKEKTRLRLKREECFGDVWCFTALERHTKMILTWHVGKRTPTDTANFADNLYHATRGRFQLTTDGFTPYRTTIPAILGNRVDFATLVKIYGESEDDRRYSCGTVTDVIATPRLGNPDPLKEMGEPRSGDGVLFRLLQLLPSTWHAEIDASESSGVDERDMELGETT
jgi:IS1 family transposase